MSLIILNIFNIIINFIFIKIIYIIKKLRKIILIALKNIKYLIILKYYNSYIKKVDEYKKEVEYEFFQQKMLTSYQKPWNKRDDNR